MGQEGPSARGWGRWPRVTEGDKEQMSVGARLQRHPGLQGSTLEHSTKGWALPSCLSPPMQTSSVLPSLPNGSSGSP